jgi:hypothetical protein
VAPSSCPLQMGHRSQEGEACKRKDYSRELLDRTGELAENFSCGHGRLWREEEDFLPACLTGYNGESLASSTDHLGDVFNQLGICRPVDCTGRDLHSHSAIFNSHDRVLLRSGFGVDAYPDASRTFVNCFR